MDSKLLNQYLRQLKETEERQTNRKNLMNSLRIETKERNGNLCRLKTNLKSLSNKLTKNTPQMLSLETEVMEVETQSKTISNQALEFQTKLSNLKQKIIEIRETRKQKIKDFSEKSSDFGQTLGIEAEMRTKARECKDKTIRLKASERQLNQDLEKICAKELESVISERDSLTDAINVLKDRREKAKKYNIEIKLIVGQNSDRLSDVTKRGDSKELIALKSQINNVEQHIEAMEKSLEACEKECSFSESFKANDIEEHSVKSALKMCHKPTQVLEQTKYNANVTLEPDCRILYEQKRKWKKLKFNDIISYQ